MNPDEKEYSEEYADFIAKINAEKNKETDSSEIKEISVITTNIAADNS